jgi:hypothetical protein
MPATLPFDAPDAIEFDRRLLECAWTRIRAAVQSARPAIIWTNHPFQQANDPLWNGHRLLREVDWVLNEAPDTGVLEWLRQQIGPHTKIIQNFCGGNHDAAAWQQLDLARYGLYGFAQADPVTTLPSADYTAACAANQKNIAIIRAAYRRGAVSASSTTA